MHRGGPDAEDAAALQGTTFAAASLSQSEVEAVLAQPDLATPLGLRDRAMLETLYSTGLRREEVLALHLSDLDRQHGTLLVRRGKGNKDRFVPIGTRALAWIDKYLSEVRPALAQDSCTPILFLTKTGRAMHPNHFSAEVREYLEKAGIAKAGACHLFRHSTATLMLEGGADVRYIQAMLGHTSLATTQIYTHVSIAKLREVHEKTHPAACTATWVRVRKTRAARHSPAARGTPTTVPRTATTPAPPASEPVRFLQQSPGPRAIAWPRSGRLAARPAFLLRQTARHRLQSQPDLRHPKPASPAREFREDHRHRSACAK